MQIKRILQLCGLGVSTLAMAGGNSPIIYLSPAQLNAGGPINLTASATYVLTGNVTFASAGTTITLSGPDAVLDLGGFTINGNAQTQDVIDVTSSNITVKNGTIRNILAGLSVPPAGIKITGSNDTVTDVVFENCAYSVEVDGGKGAIVRNCTSSGASIGFYVTNSGTTAWIYNCVANNGTSYGFYIDTGTQVVVQNCKAYYNTYGGFLNDSSLSTLQTMFIGNIAFSNGIDYASSSSSPGTPADIPPYYKVYLSAGPVQSPALTPFTNGAIPTLDHTLVNYSLLYQPSPP